MNIYFNNTILPSHVLKHHCSERHCRNYIRNEKVPDFTDKVCRLSFPKCLKKGLDPKTPSVHSLHGRWLTRLVPLTSITCFACNNLLQLNPSPCIPPWVPLAYRALSATEYYSSILQMQHDLWPPGSRTAFPQQCRLLNATRHKLWTVSSCIEDCFTLVLGLFIYYFSFCLFCAINNCV